MAKKARTGGSKKVSEEESRRDHALSLRRLEVVESLGKTGLLVGGAIGTAYVGLYLPVKVSAGQTTTVSYIVDFLANVKADVIVSWGVSAGAAYWGYQERNKRLREREEKDKRIIELEEKIDPNRTSSNLLPSGETQELAERQ